MRLRSRFRSIALVLILHLLFLWATPVSAQTPPVGRWTSLEQILTPGQRVAVPAAVAYSDPAHDVAFMRVRTGAPVRPIP